jgi:hypothetical protein
LYKYIPFTKQGLELEKFDIVIDQAPTSPNQKQQVWAITSQILQMNILPPQAVIELLKYSPYPESVVQEIRNALGMDGAMPPQMLQQKLQQAEQALKVLEEELKKALEKNQSTDDDNAIKLLQTKIDDYKAQTDRLEAKWQARLTAAGTIIDKQNQSMEGGGSEGQPQPRIIEGPSIDLDEAGTPSPLEEKVDELAGMMQQMMLLLKPPEPEPAEAVPTSQGDPNAEPQMTGE